MAYLLNREEPPLKRFAVDPPDDRVGVVTRGHGDESEAAGLLSPGVSDNARIGNLQKILAGGFNDDWFAHVRD